RAMPNCSSTSGIPLAKNSCGRARHENPGTSQQHAGLADPDLRYRTFGLAVGYDLNKTVPWLVPDLLDPYFVSKPSDIFEHFLILSCLKSKLGIFNGWFNGDFAKCMARNENNLWIATAVTLKNTFFGFIIGVSSGLAAGLLLGRSDRLSAIFQPFITAVNSIPRIALAPIIVLAFGIGDTSKIVTSWIVVVFLVFFNTFEGARSIDEGFINAARLLGASEWQITRTVVIPSTMAWVFASL